MYADEQLAEFSEYGLSRHKIASPTPTSVGSSADGGWLANSSRTRTSRGPRPELIVFTHTEFDSSRKGLGAGLHWSVAHWTTNLRVLGLRVPPICPFVQA